MKDSNKSRVKQDFDEYKAKPKQRSYVGVILGAGDYNADNIDPNGALGVSIGAYLDDHFAIEGSFLYSNYELEEFWRRDIDDIYKEIDQYDFSLTAKYSILPGRLKPYVSGSVGYIYRVYTDRTFYEDYEDEADTITSNSVNAGFGVGLDFFVNERFSVGFEYRYSLNVYNNSNSDFLDRDDFREPSNTEPVEEIEYSTMAFTSKLVF
ncbi:MAG: porin family protein [Pseudomonadota bacterium]